jgi:hypothetical protein
MDTLYRVKSMPIKPPSIYNTQVPPEIDSIVMTALERDPDARWQRAAALRVALTTEMQRLGLAVLDQHVVEWCTNVFDNSDADTPAPTRILRNRAPSPSIVIERIEQPHDPDFDDDDLDDDDLMSTRLRTSAQRVAVEAHDQITDSRQSIAQLPLPPPPASNERPSLVPLSGSRTAPTMKAHHTLTVDAADVLHEANVRVSASMSIAPAPAPPRPVVRRTSNWVIALLLVLTAAAAGAVVYFGLPYIQ